VVFIVSITGCLYAFQEEIQDLTQPFRFVEAQNKAFLEPSKLEAIAKKALPDKQLHAVMYSGKQSRLRLFFSLRTIILLHCLPQSLHRRSAESKGYGQRFFQNRTHGALLLMASANYWSANGCDFNFGFCRNADFWYHLVVAQKRKCRQTTLLVSLEKHYKMET